MLNGADLPEEWENVIDSNGKLVKNKVSCIKSGDGVNTVDQVVKTEKCKSENLFMQQSHIQIIQIRKSSTCCISEIWH